MRRSKPNERGANTKPQLMRNQIAALAARLMAEDGVADYALAKRKAARQLGAPSTQSLPDNEEIESALKSHRELYQPGAQVAVIQELRRKALAAMRFFEKFDPYLTGPVLKGTAGPHSVINVQLFAANEKEIELFLLDRHIPFEISEERHFRHKQERSISVLGIDWDGTPLDLALYEPVELRGAPRSSAGSAADRAGIAVIERLLADGIVCKPE